jgi:endonuclease/exonuclease/phosphatase family metal-dependent hydrolase
MQASRIPERVRAAAGLIAQHGADLVGLQEVSLWRSAPADRGPRGISPTGPWTTDHDALALLLADLAALGTPYTVAVENTNYSNETIPLPVVTPGGLRMAAFSDSDITLVCSRALHRGFLGLGPVQRHTFRAKRRVSIGGTPLDVPRGWSAVDVELPQGTVRFANTHLEALGEPPHQDRIRNEQAAQLADALMTSPHPVILVGDVNVRPAPCTDERPGTPQWQSDRNIAAYRILEAAGLREVWPLVHPDDPCGAAGWTSGQDALDNTASTLDHRIDDVFLSEGLAALQATVVGNEEADRTPSGLWPSDHASTWATVGLGAPTDAQHAGGPSPPKR